MSITKRLDSSVKNPTTIKITELLLQRRADVHSKFYCKDGYTTLTALNIAATKEIMQLLLNYGAKFK